jgi:hypothetical protein
MIAFCSSGGGIAVSTGSRDNESHCVLGFVNPSNPKENSIVHMTRMQYAKKAKVCAERTTFWALDEFVTSIKNICRSFKDFSDGKPKGFSEVTMWRWKRELMSVWRRFGQSGIIERSRAGVSIAASRIPMDQ